MAQTITPAYLWKDFEPTRTTYGKMNEWRKMEGGVNMRSGVPVTLSNGDWEEAKRMDNVPEYHTRPDSDYNHKFKTAYSDLTSKIAYRYPNPGLPRLRQGRIGGTWRHIKEVLGHGGSRVVFVDGLVGVYDQENFNQSLNNQLQYRPHLRQKLFSPSRHFDASQYKNVVRFSPNPQVEELPMISENERARKHALQGLEKYKGVYKYK